MSGTDLAYGAAKVSSDLDPSFPEASKDGTFAPSPFQAALLEHVTSVQFPPALRHRYAQCSTEISYDAMHLLRQIRY
eukprot:3605449-Rhodomonas_salina.6